MDDLVIKIGFGVVFLMIVAVIVANIILSPTSGTYTEGNLRGCTWTETNQGTITRCPNSTTTTTYRVHTGKTSHEVSNTVVSE